MSKTFWAVAVLALGLAMLYPSHQARAASTATQGSALQVGNGKAAAGDLGAVKQRGKWVLVRTFKTQYKADQLADQLRTQGYYADVTYRSGIYYVWYWQA
jgi:hypothetical protein